MPLVGVNWWKCATTRCYKRGKLERCARTHDGILEEVILLLILFEEEDIVVFSWPSAVHIYH